MGIFKKLREKKEEKKKVQAAMADGEEFGNKIAEGIEKYSNERLSDVTVNLIAAFKQRLETVYDDKEIKPEEAAEIELNLFANEIEKFSKQMWEEYIAFISPTFEVFEKLLPENASDNKVEEALGPFADLIDSKIEEHANILIAGAKVLYDEKINEIHERNET